MLDNLFPIIPYYDIYGLLSTSSLIFILIYIQIIEQRCQASLDLNDVQRELILAKDFLVKGRSSDAMIHFHNAVEMAPNDPTPYFSRATGFLTMGKYKSALNDFNKVISIKPDSIEAKLYRADIYLKLGDYDLSHIDYENILRQAPQHQVAQNHLALIQNLKQEYERVLWLVQHYQDCMEALPALTNLLKSSPMNAQLHQLRAECYEKLGDYPNAISDYRAISGLVPDDTDAILRSSMLQYASGAVEDALTEIRKCLKIDPESKSCFPFYKKVKKIAGLLAEAEAEAQAEHWSLCVKSMKKMRQLSSSDGQGVLHRALQKECLCLTKEGQATALERCNQALEIEPNDVESLLNRAQVYADADDNAKAEADYKKVKEIDPNEPRAQEGFNRLKKVNEQRDKKDYYKVLGVKKSATTKEINRAYRKLARKWHPDSNKDNQKIAEQKFQEIAEAKEVLSDTEKRKMFDSGVDPNKPESHHQHGSPFFFQGGGAPGGDFFDGFPFQGQGFQFRFDFG